MIKNKISETKPHDKNVLINYIVAGIREIKGLDIVDVNISSIKKTPFAIISLSAMVHHGSMLML